MIYKKKMQNVSGHFAFFNLFSIDYFLYNSYNNKVDFYGEGVIFDFYRQD